MRCLLRPGPALLAALSPRLAVLPTVAVGNTRPVLVALLWWNLGFAEEDIFPRMAMAFWLVGTWTFFPLFTNLLVLKEHRTLVKVRIPRVPRCSVRARVVPR